MTPKLPVILAAAVAAPLFADAAVDFEKEIKPMFELHCVRCHNEKATAVEKGETDYLMDTKGAAIKGRYIVPGKAEKSKVWKTTVVDDDDSSLMPPLDEIKKGSSRRLTKEETDLVKRWIDEGAQWPDNVTLLARKAADSRYPNDTTQLADGIHARVVKNTPEKVQADMKPYSGKIVNTDVVYEMVPIPGGKFMMGSPANEPGRAEDEGPQREVEIAPFWMGKHEVTWNEFQLFMYHEEEQKLREGRTLTETDKDANKDADSTTHPTKPYVEMSFGMGTDGYPAISMTQHAANKYCQWLSAKTGHFYRLPTEAEWEYAARAGTTTAYFWGNDAAAADEYAWYGKNSDFKYQKVGKKKPNPWGLYDMIGNVTEWVLDQYDPGYYAKMPTSNPWNKATQPYPHVARGGSWDDEDVAKLRVAARRASNAEWKRQDPQLPKSVWWHTDAQFLGFRIVRPLKVPTPAEMAAYWNSGVEKDDPRLSKE